DRHLTCHLAQHDADDRQIFAVLERRSLAGRPARDEEVDALAQLETHQTAERVIIQGTIPPKRGHQSGAASTKVHVHIHPYSSGSESSNSSSASCACSVFSFKVNSSTSRSAKRSKNGPLPRRRPFIFRRILSKRS